MGGLVADLADAVQGVGGAGRENPGTFEGGNNALDLSGSVEPGAAALNQLLGEYLTELPALDERTVRVGVDTGLGTRTVDGQQGLNRSEDTEVHRLLGGVDQSRIDSVHSAPNLLRSSAPYLRRLAYTPSSTRIDIVFDSVLATAASSHRRVHQAGHRPLDDSYKHHHDVVIDS